MGMLMDFIRGPKKIEGGYQPSGGPNFTMSDYMTDTYQNADTPNYPLDVKPSAFYNIVPRPINYAWLNWPSWHYGERSGHPGRIYNVFTPPLSYPPPADQVIAGARRYYGGKIPIPAAAWKMDEKEFVTVGHPLWHSESGIR